MPKRYNTPHRSHVVKTRLTDEEYADFTERLAPYGISQSEFLRQAIRRTTIRPVLHVSSVNDELLSAVGKLTAEYGRIGGNLNQIARTLNEWHIIDDFGMERGTDYGLEQVFHVIDTRYRSNKPLIATTNRPLDELKKPTDTAHSRIYDRLLSMCVPIRFTGVNFRQETAKRKMETMKKLLAE